MKTLPDIDRLIADLGEEATSGQSDEYARDLMADASAILYHYRLQDGRETPSDLAQRTIEAWDAQRLQNPSMSLAAHMAMAIAVDREMEDRSAPTQWAYDRDWSRERRHSGAHSATGRGRLQG